MSFYDKLDEVREGNISQIEVINEILNQTQKEPERIQMYIDEIDFYLFTENDLLESEIYDFLQRVFKEELTLENTKDSNLNEREKYILHICERDGIKSIFDIPQKERKLNDSDHPLAKQFNESNVFTPNFEHFYYVGEFFTIYSLKNKLKKYLIPQPIIPKEKTTSKNVWGLVARFELLNDLGVISTLKNLSETDKAKVISKILGCNEDNAKKLKNGTYPTSENKTEQLERNQLISKIKQTPTS